MGPAYIRLFALELIQLMLPDGRSFYLKGCSSSLKGLYVWSERYKMSLLFREKTATHEKTRNERFLFILAFLFYRAFCRFSHLEAFSHATFDVYAYATKTEVLQNKNIRFNVNEFSSSTTTSNNISPENKFRGLFYKRWITFPSERPSQVVPSTSQERIPTLTVILTSFNRQKYVVHASVRPVNPHLRK